MELLLTFDLGTTSVKTCLFDRELHLLGSSTLEYQVLTPGPGLVELPAQVYWDSVRTGTKLAAEDGGLDLRDVRAVSVSTQGETLIPVDRQGSALYNAVVWLDERAGKEAEHLSCLFPPADFYFHTGVPECTGYCPVSKLLWFKEQRPEIYQAAYKFLLLEDFILLRLTGRFVTEKSLLCTTGYFDIGTDTLWDDMFRAAELDMEKIPEILECGTVVGQLLPDTAAELGIPADAVAVTAAMDQTAAAVGAGNLESGIITETTGTALCIGATAEHPDMTHPARICVYRHIRPGKYLLLPTCMTAGMVLKWFKDAFCEEESQKASEQGRSVYALLDDIVENTSPGANGLTLLPYFTGVIQPDNDPKARGVFFGVGLDTGKPEFLRAIFEGIAYMLRENVALIEQVDGQSVTAIRSLGGGSRSRVWRQIKADVCGVEIASMEESECTSLGAAILSALALGYYPDAAAAAAMGNRVKTVLRPNEDLRPEYDAGFARYQRVWQQAKPIFDKE